MVDFNPYREWLELDVEGRRPDRYELLGLARFEDDLDLIRSAIDAKTNTVRHVRPGQHLEEWQRVLDELSETRRCLTDPSQKRQYDEQLRLGSSEPASAAAATALSVAPQIEQAAVSNPLPPGLAVGGATPHPPADPPPAAPASLPPLDAPPPSPAVGPPVYAPYAGQLPIPAPGYYPNPGYPSPGYPMPGVGGAPASMPAQGGYPPLAMAIPVAPAQHPGLPAGMPPGVFAGTSPSNYLPPPGGTTIPATAGPNPADPMAPVPGYLPGLFGQNPPVGGLPVGGLPVGGLPVGAGSVGIASGATAVPPVPEIPAADAIGPATGVSSSRRFLGRRRNNATSLVITATVCIVGVGLIVLLFDEVQRRNEEHAPEPSVASGASNRASSADREIAPSRESATPRVGPVRSVPTRKTSEGPEDPQPDMPSDPAGVSKPDPKSEVKVPTEVKPAPTESDATKPSPKPETPIDPKPEPKPPTPEPPTPEPIPQPPPAKKPEPAVNDVAQMISALALAKTALGERRLEEAKIQIDMASNIAKAANHKAMTGRMGLLHHYVVEFWKAVRESLKTANMIDELEVGNTRVAIVAASEESLTIRAAGQNRTYETMSLPAGVAMALATRWLDVKAPSSKIIRGAFHAVDPNGGDPAQARRLWEEAKLLGGEVDELMPVLDDKFDLASLPVTKATARQGPTPTGETIAVAAKQVKEKYAKEISAAKNKEQKYALVKKLMDDASVEMPNESYRYALLAAARDQCAAAKFAQLLVQVVDEMERWFKIDALSVKYDSLSKAAATTTPGNARDFAIECLALTEKAIADKRYDVAAKAAKVAHTTARRANDRDLAAKASDKAREIGELSGKPAKPLEKTKPNGKAKPGATTAPAKPGEKPPFAKQMA